MSSRKTKASKASKSSRTPNAEAVEWGEWQWSEEYGQYYRYCYNEHGEEVDFQYSAPENVPKSFPDDPAQQLAAGVGSMRIEDPGFPEEQTFTSEQHYTHGHSPEDSSALDRKGKGIEISPEAEIVPGQTPGGAYHSEPINDLANEPTNESTHDDVDEPFYAIASRDPPTEGQEQVERDSAETDESNVDTQGEYPQPADGTSSHVDYGGYGAQVAAAMDGGRRESSQLPEPGQPSAGQDLDGVHGYTPQSPEYAAAHVYPAYEGDDDSGYTEPSSAYEAEGDGHPNEAYEEEMNTVPEMPRTITGTSGDYESTDPRFMLVHSSHWQPGTVFKILWADPQGQSQSARNGTFYTERRKVDSDGRSFYIKLRRFIIYGTGEGQSTCVPIYTYNNQGCKKSGVKPENHGIVYDFNANPRMLPGEPDLGFSPAAIVLTESTEKITKESRVNYSQLMTVQHNVKIFIIGYIHEHSFETVLGAVDHCWNRLSTNYGGAPKPKPQNPKKERGSKRHHHRR